MSSEPLDRFCPAQTQQRPCAHMSLFSPREGPVRLTSQQTEQKVLLHPLCNLSSETPIWKVDLERVNASAGWQTNAVGDQPRKPRLVRDPIKLITLAEIALSHLPLWPLGTAGTPGHQGMPLPRGQHPLPWASHQVRGNSAPRPSLRSSWE